ncbi:respiratory chain complex I subunit 1 family protein [Desulfonatronovibrio hydrogenovorans]|uniref:respiratory chain complex I subunit 1 family protein n=1 Tax=Desulfonatronovibrio hydrogenovorans TaxID=53245 RepID=UPI00048D3607|nr:NADH-quinone oxidoreductase subunit H [Desulfonatronovibrio hydrogenovorans]
MSSFFFALAATILAPAAGAIISGIDRKLTAWFQGRTGPPVWQPFFDIIKLLGNENRTVNPRQLICVTVYLLSSMAAVFLFFLQTDLLLIFFILTIGAVSFIMAAMSVPSPYSQVGAQRELIQVLTYEPLLLLSFVGFFLVTGTFNISGILAWEEPLLFSLPLVYVALGFALTIKLRKSPFDISASHHGHQEIVKGSLTDFSGPQLAMVEIAHWFEVILILGVFALFWSTGFLAIALFLTITYLAEIIIDNLAARSTWRWMIAYVWPMGLGLILINYIIILTF